MPKLISFILKYLSIQDLEKYCSINDIQKIEINLKLSKRIEFLFRRIVQDNYTVKEFYLKLKEYNLSKKYPKEYLKQLFFRGLLFEDTLKVIIDELQVVLSQDIIRTLIGY